jgi:hypothetical protein
LKPARIKNRRNITAEKAQSEIVAAGVGSMRPWALEFKRSMITSL